jgi:heme-degrading monooxygenase HmoA
LAKTSVEVVWRNDVIWRTSVNWQVSGELGYLAVWQFRPRPGAEQRFEEAYGPLGPWARLFARAEGFVRTELNRDLKDSRRYLTLDFWTSKEAYESFRARYAAEYAAIDQECEALTDEEKPLGEFSRVVG